MTEPIRKLIFRHEVLRAKLELKNRLFETVVREVYEQTGQALSLARVRLATIERHLDDRFRPNISDAGNLVGEAISSLRKIGKNLFPEQEILTDRGFINIIYEELQFNIGDNVEILQLSGTPSTPAHDSGVIVLSILLSIISSARRLSMKNTLKVKLQYTESNLLALIDYVGEPIDLGTGEISNEKALAENLNIPQRLALIRGSIALERSNDSATHYQITVPI